MTNMTRVLIRPAASYPDVVRKIVIAGRNEDLIAGTISLICLIEHYDQQGARLHAFRAIERDAFVLVASDDVKVDAETGVPLAIGEDGHMPSGGVGQYTWIRQAIEGGSSAYDLAITAVLQGDQAGIFT